MGEPRWCACGRHAIWWIDHVNVGVHDKEATKADGGLIYPQKAWVMGIMNSFLNEGWKGKHTIQRMIDECPPDYKFKKDNSPVVLVRPGQSRDSGYYDLP